MITWDQDDQNEAIHEGWGIFDNSDHGLRIEKCDDKKVAFKSDAHAQAWVADMAMEDVPTARRAWLYLAQHYGSRL